MWNRIEMILTKFKEEFSNRCAFKWFVTIIVGLMIRTDHLGLTSVIRDLFIDPISYDTMIKFFRANSWNLESVRNRWCKIVKACFPLFQKNGRSILIGDGTKQAKEGRSMPGVKRMAQESGTQSKPSYIQGHMWGCISVLIGDLHTLTSTPLKGSSVSGLSHVVEIARDSCRAAQVFGNCYCLLDRYFLSNPLLSELNAQNALNPYKVDIITRAKRSVVAYQDAPHREAGQRGRTAKVGQKIKLMELFHSIPERFLKAEVHMYGKSQKVRYYSIDLIWSKKLYQKLRFVLVEYGSVRSILVSTDLSLDPISIIELYSYRFKIESMFRELKQQIGGFTYHFWTQYLPKLSPYMKKKNPDPLSYAVLEKEKERILKTIRATEMYALMSNIAMGILQYLSVDVSHLDLIDSIRYQRTPAKGRCSEATIMHYLRSRILLLLEQHAQNEIPSLIRSVQLALKPQNPKKSA